MDKKKSKKRKFKFSKKKLLIILISIIVIIALYLANPTQKAYRTIKKINVPDKMNDSLQLPIYLNEIVGKYNGELSTQIIAKTYNNFAENIIPKYYRKCRKLSEKDVEKYYKRNKKIIKIELGFSNQEEFKQFIKILQQLQGDKLTFESYRILRTTVINENDFTSAYLGITYSNNKEIIFNTKLSNEVKEKETSIMYSFDIDDTKIENDNQKQKKLNKQLENSRSPYTRGSPIE